MTLFFSNPIIQHLANFLLLLSLIFALRAAIVTYTIGKKTNKKAIVLRISIATYILGIIATILLWISATSINDNSKDEIKNLRDELYSKDSINNIVVYELDSTKSRLTSTKKKLDSTSIKLDSTTDKLSNLIKNQKPRHLTQKQKSIFLDYVKNCPNSPVGIKCVTEDKEAWAYATEFLELLKKTNFRTHRKVMGVQYFTMVKTGIFLQVNDEDKIPPHIELLQDALNQIGINAPAQKQVNLESDYVFILIGHK